MTWLLGWCDWIAATRLSATLGESTWGVPIVGAVHVLAIALFGGVVFARYARVTIPKWMARVGLGILLLTGVLLFWSQPVRCYHSSAFWMKLGLIAVIPLTRGKMTLVLWAGVILASRLIAYG